MRSPALLAFALATLLAAPASAGCRSAAQIAADLWKKWGDEALIAGCAVAAVEGVPFGACLKAAQLYEKIAVASVRFWNTAAANSWATLGPRRIELGTPQSGTLVSTGGRLFLSSVPLDTDEVEVEVTREDGKAGAEVSICRFTGDGRGEELAVLGFAKKGEEKTLRTTVRGLRGAILAVHLDAKSVVRKFEYRLRVTPR